MSLIVFSNGVMLADRLGGRNFGGIPYTMDMQKLYIHETKLFAFVVSGNEILKRQVDPFMDCLAMLLTHYYLNGAKERIEPQPDMLGLFKGRTLILMTRDRVFYKFSGDQWFTEMENEDWMAQGSYNAAWRVAHTHGLSAVKAAEVAIRFLINKQPTIDSIRQRDLKKWPALETKKEKVPK